METVCIVDVNTGNPFPQAFWADWDGEKVIFGGDWSEVPDMPSSTEPTRQHVNAWAEKHAVGETRL